MTRGRAINQTAPADAASPPMPSDPTRRRCVDRNRPMIRNVHSPCSGKSSFNFLPSPVSFLERRP